jgi:hypothetical protein
MIIKTGSKRVWSIACIEEESASLSANASVGYAHR